jgi:hypothetical protein
LFKKVLVKDRITGAMINAISPLILKPGAKREASHRQNPFTIKENPPKVKKVSGSDKAASIGLIEELTNPIMIAAIKAEGKLAISTPGTRVSTTNSPKPVAKIVTRYAIIFFLLINFYKFGN